MPGEYEKGQKTRQRMIEAAMDLFHAQGVRATSPQDVMDRTGTGKSQFYHYFGNKEGLVHESLQYMYAALCEGRFNNQPIKTWRDLENWFQFFVVGFKGFDCQRGCPVGTIGYELDVDDELIRQDVNAIFQKLIGNVERFFSHLKAEKKLKSSADPAELARFCLTSLQGGLLIGKIQQSATPLETAVNHTLAHLKTYKA